MFLPFFTLVNIQFVFVHTSTLDPTKIQIPQKSKYFLFNHGTNNELKNDFIPNTSQL